MFTRKTNNNNSNDKSDEIISDALLAAIRAKNPKATKKDLPSKDDPKKQRDVLGDICIASDRNWEEDVLQLMDQCWKVSASSSSSKSSPIKTDDLLNDPMTSSYKTVNGCNIYVWKGDITQLAMDGIVNAANEHGLGCFVPEHKCIDNIIHRAAGPRLRMECREAMKQHGGPLMAGTLPLVTRGYNLSCKFVLHVTGPQLTNRSSGSRTGSGGGSSVAPTATDRKHLAAAYRNCLDVALKQEKRIRSIAFPCISTGLFGYPNKEAALIAIETVHEWLLKHPHGSMDHIVFDVFLSKDEQLYKEHVKKSGNSNRNSNINSNNSSNNTQNNSGNSHRDLCLRLAKHWIDEADAIWVVAGAGMSVKEGEMVYVNRKDFQKYYPWMPQYGYNTSYETMGVLMPDPKVAIGPKWSYMASHMDNVGWKFTPNDGYTMGLKPLLFDKDYRIYTSNADRCFRNAGFDVNKIYTPQGEWTYIQCRRPCRSDAVFPSRPYLDRIVPVVDQTTGHLPDHVIPKCPYCQGPMSGNVRGGNWYLHTMYQEQNQQTLQWLQQCIQQNKRVVVIEIGAGFNTPMVTRYPVESFVKQHSPHAKLIRINPSHPKVPDNIPAIVFEEGWQVLLDIVRAPKLLQQQQQQEDKQQQQDDAKKVASVLASIAKRQQIKKLTIPGTQHFQQMKRMFGHSDWKRFIQNLAD